MEIIVVAQPGKNMKIPNVTIQQLLEAGVHLGHKTLRWNPKMKKYIFGKRDSIHIIDLTQTLELTNIALEKIFEVIKNNGKKNTANWAKSVVSNMARTPKGNDRAQILAVAAGEADIAVANTYYHALMLSGKKGEAQQSAARKVKPFFPNQQDRGTHMNISGAGMLKYAPNKSNAVKLIEFLLTPEAQEHIVNNTYEYPMIEGISPNSLVPGQDMAFKQDLNTKVKSYGAKQADALEVMLAAGWK